MYYIYYLIVYLYTATAQQQGDLRLMNGSSMSSHFGRVEIYNSVTDQWGTICIDGFTLISANTTCKQLGWAGAVLFGRSETLGWVIQLVYYTYVYIHFAEGQLLQIVEIANFSQQIADGFNSALYNWYVNKLIYSNI